jgi:YidC/Oxa1 family membrane protein insertase
MEKRALLAVALSLLILVAYQLLVSRYYPAPPPSLEKEPGHVEELPEQKHPESAAPSAPRPQPALKDAKTVQGKSQPAREIKVETDDYLALFTNQGARLKSFKLKHYRASVDEKSPPFEMVPSVPGIPYPLGIQLPGATPFNDEALTYSVQGSDLHLSGSNQGRLLFEGRTPNGAVITKEFNFTGSGYAIGMQVSVEGAAQSPTVLLTSDARPNGPNSNAPFEGLLADVAGKLVREHGDALAKGKEWSGKIAWAGFGHTYFLFAVLPDDGAEQKVTVRGAAPAVIMEIGAEPASATTGKATHTIFIGPKELDILKGMNRGLERAIDFGWFAFVSMPLLYVMHFFHRLTASYAIDIILLTVLIKLLLAPLTHKSFVSMKQMQKLQPQMERLKEKYKDDKEGLNKEIMELYRRNKVNPFGGCLPMLLQFPVFIGLYNALRTPIELRHATFFWIKDLSRPDWESLPLTVADWHVGIPILTLLMGASMFLQQWMTPSAGDPNQRRMMMMMPLVFTFMFINFPSGLTIYWLVNNLLSIAQQYLINRMHK